MGNPKTLGMTGREKKCKRGGRPSPDLGGLLAPMNQNKKKKTKGGLDEKRPGEINKKGLDTITLQAIKRKLHGREKEKGFQKEEKEGSEPQRRRKNSTPMVEQRS